MLVEQMHGLQRRMAAPLLWPDMHFADPPACALANLLGVNAQRFSATPHERALLEKTQWFDKNACEFLQQYPAARVLEIGAGLSTRFHRLCSCIDWPRFSWVDLDARDAINAKAKVLPPIDNYQLLDTGLLDGDWLPRLVADKCPLLVVIEDFSTAITHKQFQKLLADVASLSEVQILWDDHWWWNPLRKGYWQKRASAEGFSAFEVTALKNGLRCLRLAR
jgi:O-methyltransferase involved in polyketide biosynthesis